MNTKTLRKTSGQTLESLIKKYAEAEQEIARSNGAFSLFGLFRHEESPDRLDLILAAPWLKTNRSALLQIAPSLPKLTPEEGRLIGRIVTMEPDAPFVQEINEVAKEYEYDRAEDDTWTFTARPPPEFPVTEGWVIMPGGRIL
jgi:hypothetical protein